MITVGMLIATAVVYYQYQFIKNYDRGYNVESVLAVPKYNMKPETYQSLKTALLDHNNIHGIGASSLVFPGALQSSINYRAKGSDGEQKSMKAVRTDGDFFELFNIKLNSGKAFPEKYEAERPMVILNHEAAKLLSWDNPEDKWFELMHLEKRAEVLGFVHDINFESLKNEVVPTVYLFDPADSHIMYLRLGNGDFASTVDFIKTTFKGFSENRFEHWFVQETLAEQYVQEKAFTKVFSIFTFIAIFIAFAGLYGLSRFICERRTKEIGIRKVLGASPAGVIWIMLRGFFLLAFLAYIIVAPIITWLLNDWLSNFAYHTTIDAPVLLFTLVAIFILSASAVIYQVLKTSFRNPVHALRYE